MATTQAYSTPTGTTLWAAWNDTGTGASSTTMAIMPLGTWLGWNSTYAVTNATSTALTTVWPAWNETITATAGGTASTNIQRLGGAMYHETEEERAARAERYRVQEEADKERRRVALVEKEAADAKARELLLSMLDEEQLADYVEKGHFLCISADGQRRYKVEKGWGTNVRLVDEEGKVLRTYCSHARERLPDEDNMVAQKLMLELDDEAFVRLANAS